MDFNNFDNKTQRSIHVEQKFGSDWKKVLMNMSIDEFNDYFFDKFYIGEEEVETDENY